MNIIKKHIIRWVFPSLPVIQLLVSLYSSYFVIPPNNFGYSLGYSLITSVFYIITFGLMSKHKYCYVPMYSSICLFIMTIVDWQSEFTSYKQYSAQYDFYITILIALLLGAIILVKSRKNGT